jgi:hypothetical protein
MNTEQRDPVLESLFAQSTVKLENGDGKAFTAGVMSGTRRMLRNVIYVAVGVVISFAVIALALDIPIMSLAEQLTSVLATPLFDLGEDLTAWVLTPVNNIASLLVICLKLGRMAWKRAVR